METINIINNFDQKIILENILITNQKKLLDMIIEIFEHGYFKNISLNEDIVCEYLNQQKFINWELFLNLINLNSMIYLNKNHKVNSLYYIIEKKAHNLINFLLELTLKDYKKELINWKNLFADLIDSKNQVNSFYLIVKHMNKHDKIIENIINLSTTNNEFKLMIEEKDFVGKNAIYYIVSKCSINLIKKLLEYKIINLDWKDNYSNTLIHWACKRNLLGLIQLVISLSSTSDIKKKINLINNGGRTPLHLACIKNAFEIVKFLIQSMDMDLDLEISDIDLKYPIYYAIKYSNSALIKLFLNKNNHLRLSLDADDEEEMFYLLVQKHEPFLVEHFINSNIIKIENTNLIYTSLLMGRKNMYSQMLLYGTKKFNNLMYKLMFDLNYYFENYYDGHYIGNMFEE